MAGGLEKVWGEKMGWNTKQCCKVVKFVTYSGPGALREAGKRGAHDIPIEEIESAVRAVSNVQNRKRLKKLVGFLKTVDVLGEDPEDSEMEDDPEEDG